MPARGNKLIKCGNEKCGHMLDIAAVVGMYPKADTPKENIHEFWAPTETPGSVGCYICGHYTIRYREKRVGD